MISLNKKVIGIRGLATKLSYPSESDLAALPKKEDGEPDTSFLPEDTYRNVLVNCLALYPIKDKRETMWINSIATEIMGAEDTIQFKEKHQKFLIDVLNSQTFQVNEKGEKSGIYMSWVISQILKDLGVSED